MEHLEDTERERCVNFGMAGKRCFFSIISISYLSRALSLASKTHKKEIFYRGNKMIKEIVEFFEKAENLNFYNKMYESNYSINQISKLIKDHRDMPIRELLTQMKLQQQASKRINNSKQFIFTSKGVQQSSSTALAQYHAEKISEYTRIADLCCGNGIDLHHIAAGKQQVWAIDLDEETLLAAQYNNKNYNNINYLQIKAQEFNQAVDAIFIDPDRRAGNRRLVEAEDLSPGLSEVLSLSKITPNILIKLSPAMNYKKLEIPVEHSWEFISENGELKEILLCLGKFVNSGKRSVLLPKHKILDENLQKIEIAGVQDFIMEPDVSIIRAGLVQDLGYLIKAQLLDQYLALLSSDQKVISEYTKTYRVVDQMNFNRKKLQKYLREKQIGNLVIKTRGFSQSVEEFRKKLKLKGDNSALIFILRIGDGHQIIFAELVT